MRYFIKAYPMHESEVAACEQADIDAAVVHEGLIQGIADEATIEELAAAGVVVQTIARAPDDAVDIAGASADDGPADDDAEPMGMGAPAVRARRPAGEIGPGGADPAYLLVDLLSGLSDRTLEDLERVGAEIVERDSSGMYVVRSARGEAALSRLPFVGKVREYGAEETLEGTDALMDENVESFAFGVAPVAPRRARSNLREGKGGLFEAILHRAEDREEVVAQIEALGAKVVSRSSRALRFVPKTADAAQVADLPGVASLARTRPPRLFHDLARPLVGLPAQPVAAGGLPFDGTGEVVGVADTGLDHTHPDFDGRIVAVVALGRPGDSSDPDGHGTHVAGSVLGDGSASNQSLAGMAPRAQLYFQSVLDVNGGLGGLPDSLIDLFQPAYDAGVRVHNNSWGAYLQSRYDSMAIEVDEFVWDHPDFLPVIAAGNEGSCRPGFHAGAGFVDFPSLGSPATAKNGLTIGASRSSRTQHGLSTLAWSAAWPDDFAAPPIGAQTISGDDQCLAGFSSRGPCEDMRIKPDVVAPGTDIASTRSRDAPLAHFWGAYPNNPRYAFMGGTSMACPIAAGCLALIRQYYRQQRNHDTPSAALLKATLINGTLPLTGDDAVAPVTGFPNYHQGFGRIDMASTLPNPADPRFDLFFADTWQLHPDRRFTQRQGRRRWRLRLSANGPVRLCCVWTDPPAKGLQNSLRMILDDTVSKKWIANDGAAAPLRFASHDPREVLPGNDRVITRDPLNNVQVIRADLTTGTYTLALFADSLLRLPQDFALVLTGPAGSTTFEEL
jgi:serine protease AprX